MSTTSYNQGRAGLLLSLPDEHADWQQGRAEFMAVQENEPMKKAPRNRNKIILAQEDRGQLTHHPIARRSGGRAFTGRGGYGHRPGWLIPVVR